MRKSFKSDAEALEALKESREAGLDYFFALYYNTLTYFAFKLVADRCLAEELASEAFIKLWKGREYLSSEGSIKSWLYTTVRNLSIDQLRKANRLRVSEAGLQTPETIEQSVLHHMIEAETIQQIIRILDLLPPKCRQVFKLYFFNHKSYEEIAHELNLSPHTVRNQKIRAVRILKAKLFVLLYFIWNLSMLE